MNRLGVPIRVAIVSRQEIVTRGLIAMLADYPDRVIVVALSSHHSRAKGVEVILYDTIGLHGGDDSGLRHLLEETEAKILLVSRDMRPDLRARAIAAGCESWVSMTIRSKELVEAIELVAEGEPLPEQPDSLGGHEGLSPREVEIMALITQGLSNAEIAEQLFLSENTLKSHVRNIYRKIEVETRSQAVAWAMQNGFAPSEA